LWEADSLNRVQLIDLDQYLYTAGIAFLVGYLLSDQGSFIDMGIVDQLTLYAPVILFSDGNTGCLPEADSSIAYVVMYDPVTGQISYGEGGGGPGGDTLWQADINGDLAPIESGVDVYAHDFILIAP